MDTKSAAMPREIWSSEDGTSLYLMAQAARRTDCPCCPAVHTAASVGAKGAGVTFAVAAGRHAEPGDADCASDSTCLRHTSSLYRGCMPGFRISFNIATLGLFRETWRCNMMHRTWNTCSGQQICCSNLSSLVVLASQFSTRVVLI